MKSLPNFCQMRDATRSNLEQKWQIEARSKSVCFLCESTKGSNLKQSTAKQSNDYSIRLFNRRVVGWSLPEEPFLFHELRI